MHARLSSACGWSRQVPIGNNTGDEPAKLDLPEEELSQLSGLLTGLKGSHQLMTWTIKPVDKRQTGDRYA
jgi:hypothetical protein